MVNAYFMKFLVQKGFQFLVLFSAVNKKSDEVYRWILQNLTKI